MDAVVADIRTRTEQLARACVELGPDGLDRPSLLPDWTVLTLACHLRYGAQVLSQITDATCAGQPSAYYPGGREVQRPFTLRPALGEPRDHVLDSLAAESEGLADRWADLSPQDWDRPMITTDPTDSLGGATLRELGLLRLVEVMVHGSDSGLGLAPWPLRFGQWVLPLRVRRARVHADLAMTLAFDAVDAMTITARVARGAVTVAEAVPDPDVVVSGAANDLVALLLGRSPLGAVSMTGDASSVAALRSGLLGP